MVSACASVNPAATYALNVSCITDAPAASGVRLSPNASVCSLDSSTLPPALPGAAVHDEHHGARRLGCLLDAVAAAGDPGGGGGLVLLDRPVNTVFQFKPRIFHISHARPPPRSTPGPDAPTAHGNADTRADADHP